MAGTEGQREREAFAGNQACGYPLKILALASILRLEWDIALAHIAFFDLMGEHSVRKVFAEPSFFGTQGVLAVCDVERPKTFH